MNFRLISLVMLTSLLNVSAASAAYDKTTDGYTFRGRLDAANDIRSFDGDLIFENGGTINLTPTAGTLVIDSAVEFTDQNIRIQSGSPAAGRLLTTDASGNASWQDGIPGPQGPKGPDGAQGAAGPAGPEGDKGALNLSCQVVTQGFSTFTTVNCPANTTLIAGGHDCRPAHSEGGFISAILSRPSGNGWEVRCAQFQPAPSLSGSTAYALCCDDS